MGEKWHCYVIHILWHGISSESLENVEFGAKRNALLLFTNKYTNSSPIKNTICIAHKQPGCYYCLQHVPADTY